LAGIECGRGERSVIGCPAAYRSAQRFMFGQEHWNRAATSLAGTCWSTTSRANFSRAQGVSAALAWVSVRVVVPRVTRGVDSFHPGLALSVGGPPLAVSCVCYVGSGRKDRPA
jgi:hypothetical protein